MKQIGQQWKKTRSEEQEEDRLKKFIESAVLTIMRVKNIKPELHRQ
jgi:hypothetical protein